MKSNIVRGRVSDVAFTDDFLTKHPQVQNLNLRNLNLAPTLSQMTAILPPMLHEINFENGLLTTFPTDFAKFTELQELCVLSILQACR